MMEIEDVKQEPEDPLECPLCSEIFKDNADFEEHKKGQYCLKEKDGGLIIKPGSEDEDQDFDLTFYECLHCGEVVNDVEDLVKHHNNHMES